MRKIFLILVPLLALSSCNSGKKNNEGQLPGGIAAKDSTTTGWINLIDGNTTNGWHTYGKTIAGSAWKMDSGILHLDASNKAGWQTLDGGDIVTNEEFENFDFKTDWKISRAQNSGIIFYVKEDTTKYSYSWSTGPESQICDNKENEDGKIPKHRSGELYELVALSKDVVQPAGQWNSTEIVADHGKLDLYINSQHVISTTLWDDNWKKLIAATKFKDMRDFGTFRKGKIALQDHGANVWFKNIMIKRL